MIDKVFDRAALAIDWMLGAAFLFAVCLNFFNVVGRYVFSYTPTGTDEVQIYIMVWMAFVGAAVVTWRNLHLRMDVLFQRFPHAVRRLVQGFELIVFLALALLVTVQSFRYAMKMLDLDAVSDLGHIPMWIPHSAVAVGFGLMALIAFRRAVSFFISCFRPACTSASIASAGKDATS